MGWAPWIGLVERTIGRSGQFVFDLPKWLHENDISFGMDVVGGLIGA
jgi:hypothetical protein